MTVQVNDRVVVGRSGLGRCSGSEGDTGTVISIRYVEQTDLDAHTEVGVAIDGREDRRNDFGWNYWFLPDEVTVINPLDDARALVDRRLNDLSWATRQLNEAYNLYQAAVDALRFLEGNV